jgi:preprotein translocase subunit YajC
MALWVQGRRPAVAWAAAPAAHVTGMIENTRAGSGTATINPSTGLVSRGGQFTETPRLAPDDSVQDQFAGTSLADARTLAVQMMAAHNIASRGWKFDFDRAESRLGQTNYRTRTITMSRAYVQAAGIESITQTMLHEIAHVHAGPGVGHGRVWKLAASRIGYTGERSAENPHALNRDAAMLAAAQLAEKTMEQVTSGPLRIGERVETLGGVYSGLLVSVARTRATVLCDQTGTQVLIKFASLRRPTAGSAAPAEKAAVAPSVVKPPAPRMRVGDRLYTTSGRTGTVTKVGRTRYHFICADGVTWSTPFSSCAAA